MGIAFGCRKGTDIFAMAASFIVTAHSSMTGNFAGKGLFREIGLSIMDGMIFRWMSFSLKHCFPFLMMSRQMAYSAMDWQ